MRVVRVLVSGLCFAAMAHAATSAQPSASSKPASAAKLAPPPTFQLSSSVDRQAAFDTERDFGPSLTARDLESPEVQVEGLYAVSPAGRGGDARLLDANRYYDNRGPVTWRSNAFVVAQPNGAVDSVRVSVANVSRIAGTTPLSLVRPDADNLDDAQDVDVTVTRGWPSAVMLSKGKYALDVTPHAGLGFSGAGGSAEAGATVRFGKGVENRVNSALGVRDGKAAFGDRGRWYLFAAASGQAVGLNMLRGEDGGWDRAGLTSDASSRLIGDAQAGVGWRRGPMQASLGYIHREIKAKDQIMGMATQEDSLVALSFSLRPHW